MKISTVRLLVPVVALGVQINASSTVIPPFLDDIGMPVALIGTLISLGPIFALLARLPVGMLYSRARARALLSLAVLLMGLTTYFYSLAVGSWTFALVHSMNGFAYSAVTTLYLAFYVDSLAPDENRNHAMGYYVGSLSLGFSTGNFFGGWIADHWGYDRAFQLGALLSVIAIGLMWLLHRPSGTETPGATSKEGGKLTAKLSLKALLEPALAVVVLVQLFLNLLHQMGGVFISLYGLAVGMNLTRIGIIRAAYAGCNAVTRPISGHVVNKFGHRGLSYFGLPLQSLILLWVPLCTTFGSIVFVYVASGFMRAIVIVANAVGLVQDVPESRVKRGLASGVYNAAGDVGNILGPSIGGVIAHFTGVASVFVIGPIGSTALFFLGVLLVRRMGQKASQV